MTEPVGKPTVTGTLHGITCSDCVRLRDALAQAEFNRTAMQRAIDELRAEVERLKERHEDTLTTLQETAKAAITAQDALARMRAALEKIANHPHKSYSDVGGQYEIGVADGHRCAANEARAALEDRG